MKNDDIKKLEIILNRYDNIIHKNVKVNLNVGTTQAETGKLGSKNVIQIAVKDESLEALIQAKAFNLHELGHCLFTRPIGDVNNWWNVTVAYNILEDQRIEWILSKRYPGMRKYFVLLADTLINQDAKSSQGYKSNLLWGRRFFLPFKVEEPIPQVRDIIDKYLVVKTHKERKKLAIELAGILGNNKQPPTGQSQNTSKNKGETDTEKQCSDIAKNKIEKEKKDKETKEKQEKEPKQGQGEKQEKEQSESKETQGEKKEDTPEKEQGEDEEKEVNEGGTQAGTEKGSDEILKELTQEIIDEIRSELSITIEELQMKKDRHSLKFIPEHADQTFSNEKALKETNITIDANLERELTEVFRHTIVSLKSNWEGNQHSGRISLRKAMNASAADTRLFRKFNPDRTSDSKISLVIMYDKSGSMKASDPNKIELHSVATITSAATKAGNEVALIEFDSDAHVSKSFNRTNVYFGSYSGGTDPERAVFEFGKIRKLAKNPIVLIIMTDGRFDRSQLSKDAVDGVRLYKIDIGGSAPTYEGWIPVNDTKNLPNIMTAILKDTEHNIMVRIGK